MSVLRVMSAETEYGISVPGQPGANAMVTSSQIVNAYQAATAARARRARWDFEEENPLRDARGFDLARESADSTQLTDEDLGLANVILTNGARLYVDHAHPEYSAPECTNPLSVVIWDKAGERIMAAAAAQAATVPGSHPIHLYKNNTDNKGVSYGTHENYLMRRSTPFADIVKNLTPFFVTRQVFTGAGRVGIGADGRGTGFQLSQRADFFEVEVGLETTLKRPIINTRDEPHADPEKYRRLHVIIGDANLSEVATYLKMGTTALVLAMIEDKFFNSDLSLETPVADLRAVSHDPSLKQLVTLRDGRKMTAVQLQTEYLELARKFTEDRYGADVDPMTADVLDRWESVLTRLAEDPMQLSRELDWVAKLELLEGYRRRENLGWDAPKLALFDLQYADVRQEKGLYNRLAIRGRMMRMTDEQAIDWAIDNPPEDTRAYFRGRCLRQYADSVAAASWDSVIFDVPGRDSLQRVPTLEPLRGTKAHVGGLLDRCRTAAELVAALTQQLSPGGGPPVPPMRRPAGPMLRYPGRHPRTRARISGHPPSAKSRQQLDPNVSAQGWAGLRRARITLELSRGRRPSEGGTADGDERQGWPAADDAAHRRDRRGPGGVDRGGQGAAREALRRRGRDPRRDRRSARGERRGVRPLLRPKGRPVGSYRRGPVGRVAGGFAVGSRSAEQTSFNSAHNGR